MRTITLIAVSVVAAICLSGCATIVGGIIGHQSGEAVAGAAIGAAFDFGDDVVGTIGAVFKGKEEQEKIKIYSDSAYIRVDRSIAGRRNVTKKLQKKFDDVSWHWGEGSRQSTDKEVSQTAYQCRTAEGKEFTLQFFDEKRQDLRIYVKTPGEDREFAGMLTSQIGIWMSEILS